MTFYSPVVKAESFACTKNSTSGHVVARLRVRTECEKWYSCKIVDLEPEDYQLETKLGQYHPLQLRGAKNHPLFLPIVDFQARVERRLNESLCVDKGCENADFAR